VNHNLPKNRVSSLIPAALNYVVEFIRENWKQNIATFILTASIL